MSSVSRETPSWRELPEREILGRAITLLGLGISSEIMRTLLDYLHLLRTWNKKIQLIGPADPAEEVVLHLVDSLTGLGFFSLEPGEFLDLGSGAGLPGLPLAVCRPDWKFTLVESRDKKAAFIRHAVRTLGLTNVQVKAVRAGTDGDGLVGNGYDLTSARALGSLKDILSLARPYMKPRGRFLAFKGPGLQEEVLEAEKTLANLNLTVIQEHTFSLPFLNRPRTLILFQVN